MGTVNPLHTVQSASLASTSNSFGRQQGASGITGGIPVEKKSAAADKDHKAIEGAVAELKKRLDKQGGDLSVALDQGTGVMVMRVIDNQTGEVVKQMPAQELLDVDLNMEKIIGLLVDNQA